MSASTGQAPQPTSSGAASGTPEPCNAAGWLLDRNAATSPDRRALPAVGPDGEARSVSHGEVQELVRKTAAALVAAGVRAEERLLLARGAGQPLRAGGLQRKRLLVPHRHHPPRSLGAEELVAVRRARLAPSKRPQEVLLVDEVPRTATGLKVRELAVARLTDGTPQDAASVSTGPTV